MFFKLITLLGDSSEPLISPLIETGIRKWLFSPAFASTAALKPCGDSDQGLRVPVQAQQTEKLKLQVDRDAVIFFFFFFTFRFCFCLLLGDWFCRLLITFEQEQQAHPASPQQGEPSGGCVQALFSRAPGRSGCCTAAALWLIACLSPISFVWVQIELEFKQK